MSTTRRNQFTLDIAFHPGETLAEKLEEMPMSIKELALRTDKPEKSIIEVIQGQASITPDFAVRLETVVGIEAQFWLRLQRLFDEYQIRQQRAAEFENQWPWAKQFPLNEMINKNLIPYGKSIAAKVQALLSFFKINSAQTWEKCYLEDKQAGNFRISLHHASNPHALSAWLRAGEIKAEKVDVGSFDKALLRSKLPEIKAIMAKADPDFFAQTQAICHQCGVLLVFVPALKGSPANGVARWYRENPLIQISGRYQRYDSFWFTFFHEIGHVLLHGKKDVFIEFEKGKYQGNDQTKEDEADDFAIRQLLTLTQERTITSRSKISLDDIDDFAQKFGTHASVIVGRLHHLGHWKPNVGHAKLLSLKHFAPFAAGES
jgi:HTH-type transcriptional regulator / antitoxin HigA